MAIKFISKKNVKGKTIIIRCDLNSNVDSGKIAVSARLKEHAQTIKGLSKKGAKLVVLAHQGRKGENDFVSLQQHAQALSDLTGKKVALLDWNSDYVSAIKKLKNSEIVLMENTRFLDAESEEKTALEHAQTEFVKELASCSDYYVLDALSVAHRGHASVVGFSALLPSFAGPVLEREILALQKLSKIKGSRLLVLGGAKPKDSIEIVNSMLEQGKTSEALLGGLLAELFLKANGTSFGAKEKFFEEKKLLDLVPKCAAVLQKYSEKISLPTDLAMACGSERKNLAVSQLPSDCISMDIGEQTISDFSKKISKAKLIVFNGTMGVYEKPDFAVGTKEILNAISKSKAFSLLGGGDTETALSMFGFNAKQFGHVSLAGKALLEYLVGKQLLGLVALEEGKK